MPLARLLTKSLCKRWSTAEKWGVGPTSEKVCPTEYDVGPEDDGMVKPKSDSVANEVPRCFRNISSLLNSAPRGSQRYHYMGFD